MGMLNGSRGDRSAGPIAARIRPRNDGIGRAGSAGAERVSDQLRRGTGSFLEQRRSISALSLVASTAMGVVAAYQVGLIRHPPEPPLGFLDAERVDASGEAYQYLHAPDAALGLVSYAATLTLAGMGDAARAEHRPWVPLALLGKVVADAISGVYLSAEQASKHRAFCGWCLTASAASVAMVPIAVPEARHAWRHLLERSS